MRKVWKKIKDLLVSITYSKTKEFDRLKRQVEKNKKKGGGKKKNKKVLYGREEKNY